MAATDSALDAQQMARARTLLAEPAPRESIWPPLAAAAFLAISALAFATAMIMAPALVSQHTAGDRDVR